MLLQARWLRDARGFSVIALDHPAAPIAGDPKQAGKVPVEAWKRYQREKPSDQRLRAWFSDGPRNIGIVTGAISNIVVIDCDAPAAERWAEAHLPPTPMMTRTGKGGTHRFYKHPGIKVRNKARVRTGDGRLQLDVRADGGYVVAPGSVHASGAIYERLGSWPEVAALPAFNPAWLVAAPTPRAASVERARAYLAAMGPAIEGQGGDAHTFRAACLLVRDFALDDDAALALLLDWNATCVPPWTADELAAKVRNARSYGDHPLGAKRDREPAVAAPARRDPSACRICGSEMCEGHPQEPPHDRRREDRAPAPAFRAACDVIATPAPAEIVAGVAWAGGVSVLASESGAGKTFVLLDASAAVSADLPWHGRAVRAGSVAYVSFESDALGLRLQALRDAGQRLEHVYVLRATDPISPVIDRDRVEVPSRGEGIVAAALTRLSAELQDGGRPPIRLVVFDTVRASMSGSEDSSETVSAYLRAVRRLLALAPGAGAILSHHAGWQDGETKRKRERGSSAFRGNVEITLYLEAGAYDRARGEAPLTLLTAKARDGEREAPLYLIRRRVELPLAGMTVDGQPITSCVIERDRRSPADRATSAAQEAADAQGAIDRRVLRVLRDHPEASSYVQIRAYAGLGMGVTRDALARILHAGWADVPSRQRQPYRLTAAGQAVLEEETQALSNPSGTLT
jgi:hypothetical protein